MQTNSSSVVGLAVALKSRMQRPRAYQMSAILGVLDFSHHDAESAATPSMISGHCLQGLVAATGAFVDHMNRLGEVPDAAAHLQQWGVDHGDRRVFAGVHYPSDNISSWYILAQASRCNLFGDFGAEARAFMKEAVTTKSHVYQAMDNHCTHNATSPYCVPLRKLHAVW